MLPRGLLQGAQELPGRELIQETVERVLAVPPFAVRELSWIEQAYRSVQQAFADLKYWALRQLGNWVGDSEVTGLVLVWIIIGIAVALLVSIVWSVVRPTAVGKRGGRRGATSGAVLTTPRFDARLEKARELAAGGRFAEAMSALYQATCLWLDHGGHARYEDDKTGGDYAREMTSGELRSGFRQLLGRFYPVAYGGRAASADSYDRMRHSATELGVPE